MPSRDHAEFGDFLRSRRERLRPEDVGLPRGERRRTPGLRRQEVAELAGIGIDWYIRLEQGRAVSPSSATSDAIARALKLDGAERSHLQSLGRPLKQGSYEREKVPAALRRMVHSLDNPAYITGRRLDVLAWNSAAAELITDFGEMAEDDRNILIYMMTDPDARRLFGSTWEAEAKRIVAQFRTTHDFWSGDPGFVSLLKRLEESPEFIGWWKRHDIRGGGSGRKRLQHPQRGELVFDYATFQANENRSLKLAVYTPIPSPS